MAKLQGRGPWSPIGSIDPGLKHSSFFGHGRSQFLKPGEEQLKDRRRVRLAVTHNQIDRWRLASQGSAGHSPRQEILCIFGHERHAPRLRR